MSRGTDPHDPDAVPPLVPDDDLACKKIRSKMHLVYAEVIHAKSDAVAAVKRLLARVKGDHASMPSEIVFRLHSDRAGIPKC